MNKTGWKNKWKMNKNGKLVWWIYKADRRRMMIISVIMIIKAGLELGLDLGLGLGEFYK
jgi:hypothetical protein